uniref:LRRNT domain-containing protein n=1 Tax=Glossina palpalis gambiensis TaxID=67801 RepID=A0A1B0BSL1_9MUSC
MTNQTLSLNILHCNEISSTVVSSLELLAQAENTNTMNILEFYLLQMLAFMFGPSLALKSSSAFAYSSITSSSCGPNFPNSCWCGHEEYELTLQCIVNCTNAGLRNTSVLEFMPDEVQILIFTGNNIPELPWNVFGSINNYKKLKIVDMSNNRIREIRGKSYHHVQNVERLILNHNNLSISRDDDEVNHQIAMHFESRESR